MQTNTKTRWGIHLGLMVVCFVMCIPALYALQLATLTFDEAFRAPPQLFPPGADLLENLSALFTRLQFGGLMLNTTLVALVVVVGKTGLSLLAGLAFVYFDFPGKTPLFFAVLLTLLMPTEIILLPLFRMMSELEWGRLNPRLALTIPFLASATGVFLFRQHFANIPREMAEAAQLDGATPLRFLTAVLIPMSWNVIGAQALIQFISTWNAYLWPVLIVQDSAHFVIQMGVRAASSSGGQTDFGLLMAAGIVASLPPLVLFVFLQRQFMNGFALTREK
jgi:sn-glycerol 3-phosphate transport system permease protein